MNKYTFTLIGRKGIEGRKEYTMTPQQVKNELRAQVFTCRQIHGYKGKQIVVWSHETSPAVAIASVTL